MKNSSTTILLFMLCVIIVQTQIPDDPADCELIECVFPAPDTCEPVQCTDYNKNCVNETDKCDYYDATQYTCEGTLNCPSNYDCGTQENATKACQYMEHKTDAGLCFLVCCLCFCFLGVSVGGFYFQEYRDKQQREEMNRRRQNPVQNQNLPHPQAQSQQV